jgi:hypothetical protein
MNYGSLQIKISTIAMENLLNAVEQVEEKNLLLQE